MLSAIAALCSNVDFGILPAKKLYTAVTFINNICLVHYSYEQGLYCYHQTDHMPAHQYNYAAFWSEVQESI